MSLRRLRPLLLLLVLLPLLSLTHGPRPDCFVASPLGEAADVPSRKAPHWGRARAALATDPQIEETALDRAAGRAVEAALQALAEAFAAAPRGVGPGPQELPHGALRLLLAEHRRTGNSEALGLADRILETLARGGLHDHLGGGFFPAAQDARWELPAAFEKRLADNALLLRAYTRGARATGSTFSRQVAEGIVGWATRELREATGMFWAALRAPAEGRFYRWSEAEIAQALGPARAEEFFRVYRLAPPGVLLLKGSPFAGLEASREVLWRRRARRVRPPVDATILPGANGLMIGALATSGVLLGRGADLEVARRAAIALLEQLGPPPTLRHAGGAGEAAQLDDYAFLAEGLLDLYTATGEARWRMEAQRLADTAVLRLWDGAIGRFALTAEQRRRPGRGQAAPEGELLPANSVMVSVLLRLSPLTGEGRYRELGRRTIVTFLPELQRAPRGWELLAATVVEWLGSAAPRR